jgi:pyridoxal phosphate enzyme (YggS family)
MFLPAGSARTTGVGDRLKDIQERIASACARVGRDPSEVTLVGVSKGIDVERMREALDSGLSHLGENKLQEAVSKMKELSDRAPQWHFIGHLQSNKARRAAELFDRIETVDSLKLARLLETATEEIGRELRLFVQVRIGGEASKSGVDIDELPSFLDQVNALPRVTVTGLMSIPPPAKDADEGRAHFQTLKAAFDRLREERPELAHLSMGMSSDFELAIEEGSTEVRVGRSLFGPR